MFHTFWNTKLDILGVLGNLLSEWFLVKLTEQHHMEVRMDILVILGIFLCMAWNKDQDTYTNQDILSLIQQMELVLVEFHI